MHIVQIKQEGQLQMKVGAELNLHNTEIDHYRFLSRRTSFILKVVQGVYCSLCPK